ncbi:DUF2829 domain-containing protein [Xenorhabdus bovienii]|uniref:Thoeris anti-defense Tad2 family protein n=1 Tax=Xenorhabdus bovienii TaxID=40576 RepID=UPI0023B2C20A|nr:MW1434 family type I TA system toxin [Xenorhabdus bovienii]MDE9498849.1 DUF2829 domain-containing protein [Xenorhabdus bovienii]MDE9536953.1 DUF2829 domain-containing protein [Xenorhabdus bovienii]MDE9589706.1 DUF2829 domain-containing protein [Xenorhabdus bovienii]
MSEVNKPENKESDLKCPFNPDEYKSDNVVAPVGSFPWAVIQVYLGNKVHRNDWDSPNEYIHLAPESAPASGGNNLPQIEKRDKHGYLASWQPTQEDMMACDWKLLSSEDHMLVFDLTLGAGQYGGGYGQTWGYIAYDDVTEPTHAFGTLNVIQNKTDIAEILRFFWEVFIDEPSTTPPIFLRGISDKNEDSYQKMKKLLKKALYVTVDDITYNFGNGVDGKDGKDYEYGYYTWYPAENADAQKLGAVMQQTGKTKRFYLNWR